VVVVVVVVVMMMMMMIVVVVVVFTHASLRAPSVIRRVLLETSVAQILPCPPLLQRAVIHIADVTKTDACAGRLPVSWCGTTLSGQANLLCVCSKNIHAHSVDTKGRCQSLCLLYLIQLRSSPIYSDYGLFYHHKHEAMDGWMDGV
jgi:hypothetical protein